VSAGDDKPSIGDKPGPGRVRGKDDDDDKPGLGRK